MTRNAFIRLIHLLLSSSLLLSCNSVSVSEICSKVIPSLTQQFESAEVALAPWFAEPATGQRIPASAVEKHEMAEIDRASWQKWAEDRIKVTNRFIDQAREDEKLKPARKDIIDIHTQLVMFHGYAQLGDARRMTHVLD